MKSFLVFQGINVSHLKNLTVDDISSLNSMSFHFHVFYGENLKFTSLNISAPRESPNTDGIHLTGCKNVEISNSVIGTGDDCISIGGENSNISIDNVACGPGHGISVGSLGGKDSKHWANVLGLNVTNCRLTGTDNGVRIKTWHGSKTASLAANLTFDGIVMKNVTNPVVIDQKYYPSDKCSQLQPSRVSISHVRFSNITGESRTKVAVSLVCSELVPCEKVELSDIDLKYIGEEGEKATATCINVKGHASGIMNPPSCIDSAAPDSVSDKEL